MADHQPPNAAFLYASSGYSIEGAALRGINVASAGMLRAMALHAGVARLHAVVNDDANAKAFAQAIAGFNPAIDAESMSLLETDRIAEIGTFMLPGPGLASYGWQRRHVGRRGYSLCGITHTTATPAILDAIAGWPTAPVYPWDAVICTSAAVRKMVATVLDDQIAYLAERLGVSAPPMIELPIIPLGIECDDFITNGAARQEWRQTLKAEVDDIVVLSLGRLSFHAKAHPLPLFQAMERAAHTAKRKLHLVMAGWFANDAIEEAYRAAAAAICPTVATHFLDGRKPSVRETIWQAADMFVAPVDNIQETFGLAPIEAMASGLPVIASDWDGLRESVRHGLDGYRVRTLAVPPGVCEDLALRFMADLDDPDYFIGQASQAVMIDPAGLADAIVTLATDDATRRRMSESARAHARASFDWPHVIGRYQALWEDLRERRVSAPDDGAETPLHPARPDPFHAFEGYPTALATPEMRVQRTGHTIDDLAAYFGSPMVSFAHPSLPTEAELRSLLESVSAADQTIASLVGAQPMDRRRLVWRGIVWLAKFGFVSLR